MLHLCPTIAVSAPHIQTLQQQIICGGGGVETAMLQPLRPLAAGWRAGHVYGA